MKNFEKTLFKFISSNQDAMEYLHTAQSSFFEDVLNQYKLNSIEDIKSRFEDQFEMFYQCLIEYYCCNLYPHPDMEVFWNVLDEMQKSQKFSKTDTNFLNALKNSSVSLYKVSHNSQNNKVILDNIIEQEILEIDQNNIEQSYIGRTIYARPIKIQNKDIILANGQFIFPEEIVKDTVTSLSKLNEHMVNHYNKMPEVEFFRHTKLSNREDISILLKKVWCKDLLAEYMLYLIEQKEGIIKPTVMH
jgi:hypothetical protein